VVFRISIQLAAATAAGKLGTQRNEHQMNS
jgi:hypothetical protein